MDLVRHLRFFVAVAEEGRFGDAAARLHMTQPPVSQGLRRLEAELGVTLLRRTSRGAELTVAGRELLPRARLLVDDAELFIVEARRLGVAADALRWGVIPHLGPSITASCSERLTRSSASHDVSVAGAVALVDRVAAGALDLAIVDQPCVVGGLPAGPVVRYERAVLVPAAHAVVAASRPRMRALTGLRFAHPPRAANPPAFDEIIDNLRGAGLDPEPMPIGSDTELVAAVAAGVAFGLSTVPAAFESVGAVRCIAMNADATALRVRVVYRSPEVREAAEALTDALWSSSR
ncbi:LysR family transcriptional regulator [Tsukamurella sp. 8F]|uniref:LysR family transcriptional regulator n=1 Tax=unclassified Tsukamurella TaxID=2633480 RepID=UPI0023B8E847|nr:MULTISPECIES: LysR family transcriptional regulator [unclassified Tsukamurella]MDF0530213.1 LysR family transcriptional regulator [Tsukamurella sp. 8J]MDF0586530.1 LysR family transcriptional regulator [Tsukamurella sp. 8F]